VDCSLADPLGWQGPWIALFGILLNL
jgi:hypothetical protein